MIRFGEVLVNLRKQKGIKQIELAKKLNISPTYLSRIENDAEKLSTDMLKKMAKVFELPVSAIVFKALNIENLENKEQKKYFKAAEPLIDALITYLLSGNETNKGKDPLSNIKSNLTTRK